MHLECLRILVKNLCHENASWCRRWCGLAVRLRQLVAESDSGMPLECASPLPACLCLRMSATVATLYIEHIGELRRFLVRRLACVETASELAHETFIRYLAADFDVPIANPRAFLYRIAGNLAIDYLRTQPLSSSQIVDLESCDELPSEAPGPERYAMARQQLDCLRRAIDELPGRCREVFVRHKFDGIPQKTLADEYGVTINAIEKHLIRALVFLRFRVMPA